MLLERGQQLTRLEEHLRRADAGHGSVVLIGGEAGAGKTTLVTEFIGALGMQAVLGGCDPLSTPRPLSPLRDFVDVGDAANLDLFHDVLDRFGSTARATVMVLEDVHWADQATLDFMRFVGRRVDGTRLLVLCTYRDDEVGLDHPLRTVIGQLARLPSTSRLAVHFQAVGDDLKLSEVLRHDARAHQALGRTDEAVTSARRAVEIAEPHGPSEQLVLALTSVAGQAMLARTARIGVPLAARAVQMADDLDLASARRAAEHVQACLELVGGDVDRGIESLRAFAEPSADVPPANRVIALSNLGSGAGEVRRYDTALDALAEAEAYGMAVDRDASVAYARAWLARVAFEQARWDDAAAYASLVDATTTNRDGFALLTARGVLGRVRVRRGDPGAVELLDQTFDGFHGHELQYRWSPIAGLAEHHWLHGDRTSMVDVLTDVYAEALETDSEWARGELGYWMWKAGEISAPPTQAAVPFAAQIAGNPEEAARLWDEIGCPYEAALARSEGSTKLALVALTTLDSLGAAPLAERVRNELRSQGVDKIPRGPTAATLAHPFGLTTRQAEVLDLIVDGLSNGQIAEQIFVSKKTVEHHVSAVYAKLGVETRHRYLRSNCQRSWHSSKETTCPATWSNGPSPTVLRSRLHPRVPTPWAR